VRRPVCTVGLLDARYQVLLVVAKRRYVSQSRKAEVRGMLWRENRARGGESESIAFVIAIPLRLRVVFVNFGTLVPGYFCWKSDRFCALKGTA